MKWFNLLLLGASILAPLFRAASAEREESISEALWKSLLSDGVYATPAAKHTSTPPERQSLPSLKPFLLRGQPYHISSREQVLAGSGSTMYQQQVGNAFELSHKQVFHRSSRKQLLAGSGNTMYQQVGNAFEFTQKNLFRRSSRKQVLAGSGNTMYQQVGNAGSINNQGAVNNQRSKVYKDGPGLGGASTVQTNDQTQSADTNPVTTTVSVDSPSASTTYTGSSNGLYGLANSGLTGVPGFGNGIGLPGVEVPRAVLPFANAVMRQGESPVCQSQQSGDCKDGGYIPLSRASALPAQTISSLPSG